MERQGRGNRTRSHASRRDNVVLKARKRHRTRSHASRSDNRRETTSRHCRRRTTKRRIQHRCSHASSSGSCSPTSEGSVRSRSPASYSEVSIEEPCSTERIDQPRQLPKGWRETKTTEGETCYINDFKETAWELVIDPMVKDEWSRDPFAILRIWPSSGKLAPYCTWCRHWFDDAHIISTKHLRYLEHERTPAPVAPPRPVSPPKQRNLSIRSLPSSCYVPRQQCASAIPQYELGHGPSKFQRTGKQRVPSLPLVDEQPPFKSEVPHLQLPFPGREIPLPSSQLPIIPEMSCRDLSVKHVQNIQELIVQLDVFQVKSLQEVVPATPTQQPHFSRFARMVQSLNQKMRTTNPSYADFRVAVAKLPEKLDVGIVEQVHSGGYFFQYEGRQFFPCAPNPQQKGAPEIWLFSAPTCYPADVCISAMDKIRMSMGNFFEEHNALKRVMRLKLLFSQTVPTVEGWYLTCIKDIERNSYKFTDGCGKISADLLKAVQDQFIRLMPSLSDKALTRVRAAAGVQLRVLGFKGLCVVDPRLDGLQLQMPCSMRKFVVPHFDKGIPIGQPIFVDDVPIEVVEFPREVIAKIPRQVLQVLEGNYAESSVDILKSHNEALKQAFRLAEDPIRWQAIAAMEHCIKDDDHDNENMCLRKLLAGFDPKHDTHLRLQLVKIAERETKDLGRRAPFRNCWNAMLVPDWDEILPQGTVYVPWLAEQLNASREVKYCAIAKCPMYELGNLRKLRMVRPCDYPALVHHTGYIVLSTKGDRPEHDKLFGADCDGDLALILIGPSCVPPEPTPEPQDYRTSAATPNRDSHTFSEPLANYLECKWESCCGLIDSALMRIASEGIEKMKSDEYKELAKMFSQEVDAEKTGVHVDRKRITELENRAFGRHGGRNAAVPSFLAYDEDYHVKNSQDRRRVREVDTLVNEIFLHGKTQFDRLSRYGEQVVKVLDPDLTSAWEEIGCETRDALRRLASDFWKQFRADQQQTIKERQSNESQYSAPMPAATRTTWVRKKVLQLHRLDKNMCSGHGFFFAGAATEGESIGESKSG